MNTRGEGVLRVAPAGRCGADERRFAAVRKARRWRFAVGVRRRRTRLAMAGVNVPASTLLGGICEPLVMTNRSVVERGRDAGARAEEF